ncbi:MAG: hypothetical protein U0796_15645 [Gemmatales bacterium]
MATDPVTWQPDTLDDVPATTSTPQQGSIFWRYYWILAICLFLCSMVLMIGQIAADVGGLAFLLSLAMLILGLMPCLTSTAERRVAWAMSQRNPSYVHAWSGEGRWWWYFHWVTLLIIITSSIVASVMPQRGGKELFLLLICLLGCTYMVMIAFVLAWRWRRLRLAHMLGMEELQSFEVIEETESVLNELSQLFPLFSGKLKNRNSIMLRRTLGDWSILLFDWQDLNKQPPRREWITVALIGLHQPLPMMQLQPNERVETSQLHWWHIFLEFPFGLIIFLVGAISHMANKLKAKPVLTIPHCPELTKGYRLDAYHHAALQRYLQMDLCQEIVKTVNKKKRFLMTSDTWLLLGSHKSATPARQLGEMAAEALQLADTMERAMGSVDGNTM